MSNSQAKRNFSPAVGIPTIQHEELFTSYYNRAFRLSGYVVEKDFAQRTLGTQRAVPLNRDEGNEAYCRELGARLEKCGMEFERGVCEEHCLAALGKPFYRETLNDRRLKIESTAAGYLLASSSGMQRTVIRSNYSFCPICTVDDIERIGFSYWRRAHRLVGVQVCARHRCELIDTCAECGKHWAASNAPSVRCSECDHHHSATFIDPSNIPQAVKRRFSEAVDGVFQGRITGPLDPGRVMQRLRRIHPINNDVDGRILAHYVLSVAGAEFVDELGFNRSPANPQYWSAAFHAKRVILAEASPHLLVYACISHDFPREDLFLSECPRDPKWIVSPDPDVCRDAMWKESDNLTEQHEMPNLSRWS